MQPVKVVIVGPFGAGKTTFIRTISEVTGVSTDREITDASGFGSKTETTVALDYGRITIDDEIVLYLFGTPGQERFEFMWEVASQGMLGFILLVDSSRPETFGEARGILDWFRSAADGPYLVAANKTSDPAADADRVRTGLGLDERDHVIPTDALDREQVKAALVEFLERRLVHT
ncbi:MAG: ATP/GTP-binding protein [Acidimicrobiia bacterium]